jgi:HEPN domain-containing protein
MQPKASIFLDCAKDDLDTLLLPGIPERSFGQHAQASIEKYLKALIFEHGIEPPYTHDLDTLVDILSKFGEKIPVTTINVDTLTDYALGIRYEDISLFSVLDRPACTEAVQTIRDYVELRIKQLNQAT